MDHRSPILGYNHNIRYRGLVFHVQTEDSGVINPHIFTHLFHEGVILSMRKLEYDAESSDEAVKALMQAQHKAVLKDLMRGAFDDKVDSSLGNHPDLLPREAVDRSDASTAEFLKTPVPGVAVQSEPATGRASSADKKRTGSDVSAAFQAMGSSRRTGELPGPGFDGSGKRTKGPRRHPTPIPQAPPPLMSRRQQKADTAHIHSPALQKRGPKHTRTEPGVGQGSQTTAVESKGKVLKSKPPIVVGGRQRGAQPSAPTPVRSGQTPRSSAGQPVGPRPGAQAARRSGQPPLLPDKPRTARRGAAPAKVVRNVREENADGLFDQQLISEKSLDEVILAYLSEDSSDDEGPVQK